MLKRSPCFNFMAINLENDSLSQQGKLVMNYTLGAGENKLK